MSGLYTDLYEVRMAASYLSRGMSGPATFSLFPRTLPGNRGFLVAAGLADCLEMLAGFRFTPADLAYVRTRAGLDERMVARLARLRFTGDVWAVPEGRVVFAGEPLLEVTAPIAEAQLVETTLLNLMTFQTTVASKAARCRIAAGDAQVVDFAFRRTHGVDAAMAVARVSAICGFTGTSNTAAAQRYGLRVVGTMAHSYVEVFDNERAAFRAYAHDFPTRAGTVFLVDTYDTLAGVRTAVEVAAELGTGARIGVRLDSGDLAALAVDARQILDRAGLRSAWIVASGGLDEYQIADLVAAGAPIDVYGVGTRMGVSADAPYIDTAYKLVSYAGRPVMKLSARKASPPGAKQIFRGPPGSRDLLALRDEPPPPDRERLLVPVMVGGEALAPAERISVAHQRFEADLAWLPASARRIHHPIPPLVGATRQLGHLAMTVRRSLNERYPETTPTPEPEHPTAVRPPATTADTRRSGWSR